MAGFFAHPVVAAVLGVLLGALLVLVSRKASRLVTPEDPTLGFAQVSLIAFGRLIVAFAAMMLFFMLAREGFVSFSLALVITFIVSLAYEAFRASHTLSSR